MYQMIQRRVVSLLKRDVHFLKFNYNLVVGFSRMASHLTKCLKLTMII